MHKLLRSWLVTLLVVVASYSCTNPVTETVTTQVPAGPADVTVAVNLPPGTPSNLAVSFLAWLKTGSDTFLEPTNEVPPFSFSGVVPGPYTLEVFARIDGVVYFSVSQTVNVSGATSVTFTLTPIRALPVAFSPNSGIIAPGTKVFLSTPTAGARIRYTTDNSIPTESSTLYTAEGITINTNTTVKARAFADGLQASGVTTASYTTDANVVAAPVFSPEAETFTGTVTVTLSTSTPGATIEYSINGAAFQTYSNPFVLDQSATIRARAKKAGMGDSPEVIKTYTKSDSIAPLPPVFSRDSGNFDTSFQLTLSAEAGATIRYTTDGSEPGQGSPVYTGPITIPTQTTTVKARSERNGLISAVVTKTYTYNPGNTPSPIPTITPVSGTYSVGMTVTLGHSNSSATIYYTTDGSDPTTSSAQYSTPFTLNQAGTVTVKARAQVGTQPLSAVVSETYVIQQGSGTIQIYLYQEGSTPKIWMWEVNGRALMQLMGHTWPGPNMTREGTSNWYYFEIPSQYYPLDKELRFKFNGSNPEISLAAPVTSSRWRKNNEWYTQNPDLPSVSATPGTSTFFTESLTVTLHAQDLTDAEYKVGSGAWTAYANGAQITLGQSLAAGQSVTLSLRSLQNSLSQSYTYTKGDSSQFITIYFKKTSGPAPKIWFWEEDGRALAQLAGFSWPGPDMQSHGGGWWKYEIPSQFYPITKPLKVHFDGGSALTRNPPVTGWYNGTAWSNTNPDGPSVSANPAGGIFLGTEVTVTLSAQNAAAPEYKIGNGTWTAYSHGQQITLGNGLNPGQTVVLSLRSQPDNLSVQYTFEKGDSNNVISFYFKKTSGPAPKIWFWEENGRALAELAGFTWPGPEMQNHGGGWWKYDIPANFYPITKALKIHFDGGSALTRNPPVTGWYNGSTWSNDNPDPPAAPSVTLNPSGGWHDVASVSVTPQISVDPRAPLTSARYKINNGSWVTYSSGAIPVTLGPNNGDSTTLTFEATNSAGTGTSSSTYRRGTQPLPSFSWKNANIYFVITDRFFDGNPSNNNSYGRPQVDATGKNIGTFHGGDIAGLTAKLNANYFTDLGVNAIWITAPYEQAHGWVGGGSAGDFAHYAYHGYYALDFSNIDSNMGTRAEFKTFVDTAHSKGIRVIMDIVMNHSGYPTLQDMYNLNQSAHASPAVGFQPIKSGAPSNWHQWSPGSGQNWFGYHDAVLDYNNQAAWGTWWGDWVRAGLPGYTPPGSNDHTMSLAYLPDFKTEDQTARGLPLFLQRKVTYGGAFANPADHGIQKGSANRRVRDWIADWLSAWVREYGIDGFRVDTAKHVEMDSWNALRTKATQALQQWRQNNPTAPGATWEEPFWMVAEVWGHGPNQSNYHVTQGGAFDSVINFAFQGVAGKSGSGPGAASTWESTYSGYANAVNSNPNTAWNFLSYISSHDTGSVFRAGKTDDQQKRAGTLLLLAPGGAQIFYGDEYGRANGDGGSDPDQGSRSSMNWTEVNNQASNPNSILNHWRRVGRFRNRNIAVGAGTHQQITATGAPYAFVRNWQNVNKVAVAVDASASTVTFQLPAGFWADGTQVRDAYSGATATVNNNQVTITGLTVGNPVLLQHSSVAYP